MPEARDNHAAPRSIELLWRNHGSSTRGPRPRLDLDQIVRAAMNVADDEGLEPLSMRKVAEKLGVGTMSLYTYVPGKGELLDLMFDQAVAGANELGEGTWRERVERIAHENWWRCHRHPWLLEITPTRPVMGPNVVARYEHELAALDGIGLTDQEMDAVVSLVAGHVERAARTALRSARMAAGAAALEPRVTAGQFPTVVRVGAAAGEEPNEAYAPEHSFEFGLSCILDGVAALVQGRSSVG
ncbi:TetR/AcrR family transcriptional regulator [Solirubrobacter ginsenosidimutans]|uniref:TetR/AcrR family transcriptional regulator n=2 Tax=Solirubrobacter ginsenosidimutans TaxID=490573 RepID=A0A9X3MPI1_9ACTN|nr:TetR/AcrR family transcriptional regulator [Solirubrobacter ginsenosidimutans]